jgi:hypothetical protein
VIEPYASKNKETLAKGEKQEIEAGPLIEAAMKGWKKLPIRPISRKEMETAVESISGSYMIEDMTIKTYPQVEKETTKIVISPVIVKPPPPLPPAQVNTIEILEPTNVIIGFNLLKKEKLGLSTKTVDLDLETKKECILKIENASIDDLTWIIGDDPINALINRLSCMIPELKAARMRIRLLALTDERKLRKIVATEGISDDKVAFSAG